MYTMDGLNPTVYHFYPPHPQSQDRVPYCLSLIVNFYFFKLVTCEAVALSYDATQQRMYSWSSVTMTCSLVLLI